MAWLARAMTKNADNLAAAGTKCLDDVPKVADQPLSPLAISGHNIDDLMAAANQVINKEGLTQAGRALTKHAAGQRASGTFPKLSGGIVDHNRMANEMVDEILNNPASTFTILDRGALQVRMPNGRGVRFETNGNVNFVD